MQGRNLDTDEFGPVPGQPEKPPSTPPASASPTAEATTKIVPAPDLIAAATQAASQALGWTSPDAVLASTLVAAPPVSRRRKVARKGLVPLPTSVAIRLPPLPAYHGSKMELRAEIDRGEVDVGRPKLDKEGHKKWKPPVADRPTLTLYARAGDHEVALARWPTTIGGWKTFQKSDGTMALKYKESVTGDALWPEVLVTPTWHPAAGMPTRHLLIKRGDHLRREDGHHRVRATTRPTGSSRWCTTRSWGVRRTANRTSWTLRIRTHGTPRLPLGQARREQRLPPAAQLRSLAARGLPREAPRDRSRRPSCPRTTCETSNTGARRSPSRARQRLPLQADAARGP